LLLCNMPPRVFRPAQPAFLSRQVLAGELFECIQEIGWRDSLKPAYEPSSFGWLMSQAAAARSHGDLRLATVYTPEGVRCGWYVCYVRRGGPAAVMQIGSRRRDQFEAVLLTLFHDAWREGASFVKGQAIPQSLALLTRHHCLFRYPGSGVLVQARDPDLLHAIHSGDAALSRLDGESWMRFATEDWT
jgi:hypothetical protein